MSVSISYPGASAQVVADTVAAPIEQQVNGVEGMLYMSSQSGNDGSYSLTVTFDVGTDLNTALVMVQNRVALAMPLLPTQVQNQGITIRKKTPDILMIVNFFSPERPLRRHLPEQLRHDQRQGRTAARATAFPTSPIMGERDYSIRAWLDPQKLAARKHDRHGRGQRHSRPEPRRAGRADRAAADSARDRLPAADRHAGPAHRAGAIRRHHRQGRPKRPRPAQRLPRRSAAACRPAAPP